jgi:hypothetical protein
MSWYFRDNMVTSDSIPEEAVGFVYKITHIPTGKYYIGKKSLESIRNVKIGKRELQQIKEDKKSAGVGGRLPVKKKVRKVSDWEKYYSSNDWIKGQVKEGNASNFQREIIQFCNSKKSLSYYEVYWMFKYNILSDENCLNGNISGKWFRKDLD